MNTSSCIPQFKTMLPRDSAFPARCFKVSPVEICLMIPHWLNKNNGSRWERPLSQSLSSSYHAMISWLYIVKGLSLFHQIWGVSFYTFVNFFSICSLEVISITSNIRNLYFFLFVLPTASSIQYFFSSNKVLVQLFLLFSLKLILRIQHY